MAWRILSLSPRHGNLFPAHFVFLPWADLLGEIRRSEPGFYDLDNVTVAEYREGKLAGDKLRQQAWIYATELFAQGPDGSEALSAAGKKRLDAVMAEFQRYPRNGALIVEGYSGKGLPGEQLSLSTDRALKVRGYLVKKFHLDPNYVGTMPMGAVASKDDSRAYWEGVAVVVLYDKPD